MGLGTRTGTSLKSNNFGHGTIVSPLYWKRGKHSEFSCHSRRKSLCDIHIWNLAGSDITHGRKNETAFEFAWI